MVRTQFRNSVFLHSVQTQFRNAVFSHSVQTQFRNSVFFLVAISGLPWFATFASAQDNRVAAQHMQLEVDASQMDRHLLTSRITLPVSAGPLVLWYPKWIPGIHGPGEQIRNIGGFQVKSASGQRIFWRRDDDDMYRFHVSVPEGVERISVELTYITNQPTRVSTGVDSFGSDGALAINFNTCVVYPEGWNIRSAQAAVRVKLPEGWQFGTSLETKSSEEGWVLFQPDTLENVIDSPLVAGRHYRLLEVQTEGFPNTQFHFVSEAAEALAFDETLANKYHQLMAEAALMFGGAPFSEYHFLVVCSDQIPGMGLEHLSCSLNGIDQDGLIDQEKQDSRSGYLLAHELVHAWCGKYRRPSGMYRNDLHTVKQTKLLWIYEGLTQYLGQVLAIRSGLVPHDQHLENMASDIGYLANRQGRQWRSLEDTAIAAATLRGGSKSWNDLRRNQDYYDEGALFWLEIDVRIRQATNGAKSLDDFCRTFFAADVGRQAVKPFELKEVIETLNAVLPFDWAGLIDRRIHQPQDELNLEGIQLAGYRYAFTDEKPNSVKRAEKRSKSIYSQYSLGLTIDEENKIRSITPGRPADQQRLARGMEVLGVNGRKFTKERFEQALQQTVETREIELLVIDGDRFQNVQFEYAQGVRYPQLVRTDDTHDWLADIFAARSN